MSDTTWFGFPPQVTLDDRSEPPSGRARWQEDVPLPAQVVLIRSLKASMAAASKTSLALIQKNLDAVKYRVANQFWAQSLDHALHMGLGVDLSYLRRKSVRCRQDAM